MALTPAEASLYYISKIKELERGELFIRDENRLQNFFTIKSSFGDTKKIKEPQDIYKFRFEEEETIEISEVSNALTSQDELKTLARVMQGEQRIVSPDELAKLIPIH